MISSERCKIYFGKRNGMWLYLHKSGILENGSPEEIKNAKENYRKQYLHEYKQGQRLSHEEFIVLFSKHNREFEKVKSAAEAHHISITAFLKSAVLAYIDKKYLVPDKLQVARIEQILMQMLNEIQRISRKEKENKYERLMNKILEIQSLFSQILRYPPELTNQP